MKAQLFSALFIGLLLLGCSTRDKARILKLGHGHDQMHPVHLSMVYMAHLLDSLSEGKLRIEIYPNAQLGKERELIELLQIGMVDICKVSGAIIENFDPDYQIFSYPYLFLNREHFFNVLEGKIGRDLLKQTEDYLLYGLTFYDSGSRCIYTVDKEVKEPADLKGLKIRVMQNNTSIRMARAMGASPTPIAQAELYTALQQGVVDGAENNVPSFLSFKHYEVCKYFTVTDHTYIPDILLAGTKTMQRLDEREKSLLLLAARMSAEYHKRMWKQAEETALEEILRAGIQIVPVEKQEFFESVNDFYDNIDDTHLKTLVKDIRLQN
jgi:tripartite ATP-independent transporter DctP family solute receptor